MEVEWSASRPGRFTLSIHWKEGWVDPKVGLDAVVKKKNPFPTGNRNLDVQTHTKLGEYRSAYSKVGYRQRKENFYCKTIIKSCTKTHTLNTYQDTNPESNAQANVLLYIAGCLCTEHNYMKMMNTCA
jgi:hypothetical protein